MKWQAIWVYVGEGKALHIIAQKDLRGPDSDNTQPIYAQTVK
jgi:hypothetical protein